MTSSAGFPDWQETTQWLGDPLVSGTGVVIGLGPHTDGPFPLSSWASVVVAIKPTGGNVTVKVRQSLNAGPASLIDETDVVVPAGSVGFESVVLFGNVVTLILEGSTVGTTVDYALYPANTTTNAQVLASAVLAFQHNGIAVAQEAGLDFEDASGFVWTVSDDPTNSRVKVTPPALADLAYATMGSVVASVTATTQAAANLLVSLGAIAFDGATPVWIEFYAPLIEASGCTLRLTLFLDGSPVADLNQRRIDASNDSSEARIRTKVVPPAGSHTYSIRAWLTSGASGSVYSGAPFVQAWAGVTIAR